MILGVDPGLDGALALVNDAAVIVVDMPTVEVTVNRKRRRLIDLPKLAHWFDLNADTIELAVIEDVHAMPNQGVSSVFKFGRVLGNAEGFVAAHHVPVRYVAPAVWKRAMGVTADKDSSRAMASKLLPAHTGRWPLKKHDGRAEAVLLALYGRRFLSYPTERMAA